MARAQQTKNYYRFVNGLITEASPLTFPEEASLDEENCVLNYDGSRQRRKGLEQGTTVSPTTNDDTNSVFSVAQWETANGDSDNNFTVVQKGRYVLFFKQLDDDISDDILGTNIISGPSTASTTNSGHIIDLDDVKTSGAATANVIASQVRMDSGNGVLFIVGPWTQPIYVVYDEGSDNIAYYEITIYSRDTEGVEYTSGTDYNIQVSANPSSLSDEHSYNLQNQGWPASRIGEYFGGTGEYPSNSEIWWAGKYIDPSSGRETWSSGEVRNIDFGNTQAPRGRFIRDIFDTSSVFDLESVNENSSISYSDGTSELTVVTNNAHGLSVSDSVEISGSSFTYLDPGMAEQSGTADGTHTVTSVPNSTTYVISFTISDFDSAFTEEAAGTTILSATHPSPQSTDRRPEAVAFYAGRVWYAGVTADYLSSRIFFSQLIQNERQYGICYQAADPTAEESSSLVDTDGGVINIPEMGTVLNLEVVGTSLVIFADNGVWLIQGGGSSSFRATDFSVRQILQDRLRSPKAVISAEGTPFFWTDTGIYTLTQDQISGYLTPQNLTAQSIQSEFDDIPLASAAQTSSVYNSVNKTVTWMYSSDSNNPEKYDTLLNFDVRLSAFYKYTVDSSTKFIAGAAPCLETTDKNKRVQYLSILSLSTSGATSTDLTFSAFTATDFLDWGDTNYSSFLETGHDTLGDTLRDKQATYIETYFKRTETGFEDDGSGNLIYTNPSSCNLTAKWEWSDSGSSGREHGPYQVYRFRRQYTPSGTSDPFDYGFEVVQTRNKIRGKGKALRLRFESEQGKDFHLLGWSIPFTANGSY